MIQQEAQEWKREELEGYIKYHVKFSEKQEAVYSVYGGIRDPMQSFWTKLMMEQPSKAIATLPRSSRPRLLLLLLFLFLLFFVSPMSKTL